MLHVHAPQPDRAAIQRHACPTCGRRTYFTMTSTPWYGPTHTCLRCGDTWQEGERLERPFAPGWRARAVQAARDHYRRVRALLPKEES